jgi:cytochrome c oxidase subunit IV
MEKEKQHILNYRELALVLISLLVLTTITVFVADLHMGAFSVAVALIIACIKVFIVLSYFMHLRYEKLFIKLMVGGVFTMFVLVVIITFIDYFFR